MNRRSALLAVVICAGIVTTGVLAVYSPTDARAAEPADPTELEGSYTVSETVLVDDDLFVSLESTVDSDTGEQRETLAFEDITYDHYWSGDGERYTKATAESADRLEEWLAETDDEVLRTSEDEHSAITTADGAVSDGPATAVYPDRLIYSQLEMTAFEQTAETTDSGTALAVYEPETGWTEIETGESTYETQYVTDTDGEVHVDEAGQLQYSNITLERVDASTWGEYVLERGESWTTTLEYDVIETAENVQPEWLEDVSED
ncbi:hypothetical protein [Natronolimnobius baerhuensis]|uniref:Uncharacterized protein n=1 Tax=Natronolimnobius baerhuensis TaxID=253108 RepID=A0A202EB90_9EURY|nr:hypothetical protein [Natronolimnobius baerhuensis]OVE85512.1 hypothetical protein B2G88_01425 [Natronolimnobius baerhuensis]